MKANRKANRQEKSRQSKWDMAAEDALQRAADYGRKRSRLLMAARVMKKQSADGVPWPGDPGWEELSK